MWWTRTMRRSAAAAVLGVALVISGLIGPGGAQAATGDGTPSDPNISFVGRWNRSSADAVPNWAGAYLRVGFTGTTVKLKQRSTVDLWASIDGGDFVAHPNVSGTVNLTPTPLRCGQPHADRQLPAGGRVLPRGCCVHRV